MERSIGRPMVPDAAPGVGGARRCHRALIAAVFPGRLSTASRADTLGLTCSGRDRSVSSDATSRRTPGTRRRAAPGRGRGRPRHRGIGWRRCRPAGRSRLRRAAGGLPHATPAQEREADQICGACHAGLEPGAAPPQAPVRAAAHPRAGRGGSDLDAALDAPGQPLDDATRAYFEPRLGVALDTMRAHTDSAAARALGARAFAWGDQLVFADGAYAPHTGAGRLLLAHELAHVAQQAEAQRMFIGLDDGSRERWGDDPRAVARAAGARRARLLRARGGRTAMGQARIGPARTTPPHIEFYKSPPGIHLLTACASPPISRCTRP